MLANTPEARARFLFHAALVAFAVPLFLPVVWVLAAWSPRDRARTWRRRTFALALVDFVLLAGLVSLAHEIARALPDEHGRSDVFAFVGIGAASVILLLLFLHARIRRAHYQGAWIAILPLIIGAALAGRATAQIVEPLGTIVQQSILLLGGLALLFWFGRHRMLDLVVLPRLHDLRALSLGCLYAFTGMMRVGAFILLLIALIPGAADANGGLPEHFPSHDLAWTLLFAVEVIVLAPFIEEVLFRGILLPGLSHQYRPTAAVLWTALIFGTLHLPTHGVRAIGPAFLAVVLGWQRLRSGRLIAPILLHAISNGVALFAASQ